MIPIDAPITVSLYDGTSAEGIVLKHCKFRGRHTDLQDYLEVALNDGMVVTVPYTHVRISYPYHAPFSLWTINAIEGLEANLEWYVHEGELIDIDDIQFALDPENIASLRMYHFLASVN